ncbi:MAG: Lipid flippase MurJ [Actinotalea sp.]|nr:Lipid flippase MurJ [Actinotalea sp.]
MVTAATTDRRRRSLAAGGGTLVGGAFGVVLPFVLSLLYGTRQTDGYFLVFSAMSFVTAMVISVAEGVGLPFVSEARSRKALTPAFLQRLVLRSALLASGLAAAVCTIVALVVVPMAGFPDDVASDARLFLLCLAPLPVVAGCSGALAAVHYAHDRFALPTASQAVRSATAMLVCVGSAGRAPLAVVALALTVGEGLRALLLLQTGHRLLTSGGDLRPLERYWRTALPFIASLALVGINPVVDKVIAGGESVGDITTLELAEKLFYVPSVLFAAMVGLVFVSSWSTTLAETQDARAVTGDFWSTLSKVLGIGAVAVLVGVAGTLALGGFVAEAVGVPSDTFVLVLIAYLVGLPFVFVVELSARMVIVLRRTGLLPAVSGLAVAINIVADLVGKALFGVVGIAVASTVTRFCAAVAFVFLARYALRLGQHQDVAQ